MKNKKKLLLFALGLIIVLVVAVPATAIYTSTPDFCNSCHSMESVHATWADSSHKDVDCLQCHADPGLAGMVAVKLGGIKQVAATIAGHDGTNIKAEVPNERCQSCHENPDSKGNPTGFSHAKHLENVTDCTSCHSRVVHNSSGQSKLATEKCESCHNKPENSVHTLALKGPFKTGPEVTKTCISCHNEAGTHILDSGHWNFSGPSPQLVGHENDTDNGKKNAINNFCISVPGNEPRCTSCHIGYGWDGKSSFDFKDPTKVDCLICHADLKTSGYKKAPAGAGNPEKGVDLVKAAQSVGVPQRSNCGSCHFNAGGGDGVKQGDLDSTLLAPTKDHDVHMGGQNMLCQDCHETTDHKIAGAAVNLTQRADGARVECASCHDEGKPHKNEELNKHTQTVACQTCHIPTFAKGKPTKVSWDWSQAGKDIPADQIPKDKYGKETYSKMKGEIIWEKNVRPVYQWYNGSVKRYLAGDPNKEFTESNGILLLDDPQGDISDKTAKIYPFKSHKGVQPSDAELGYLLTPKTFGGYWKDYDWNKALEAGTKASGLKYSGKYEFVKTEMLMGIDHEVVPADKALKCNDCHDNPNGVLDWKALGYNDDPIKGGGRFTNNLVK